MIRKLQSTWVALLLGLVAYAITTAIVLRPQSIIGQVQAQRTKQINQRELIGPSWAFKNPEVEEMLTDLRNQREALNIREKELNDLAARLALEREEIGTVTQRVAQLQSAMDQAFLRIKEEELSNLKRLARVYGSMSPEGAAKILSECQDDAAVKVLALMKESETAPILENMAKENPTAARRVALISDRLRLTTGASLPEKPKGSGATSPSTTPKPPASQPAQAGQPK